MWLGRLEDWKYENDEITQKAGLENEEMMFFARSIAVDGDLRSRYERLNQQ